MRTERNAEKDYTTGIVCKAPWRVIEVQALDNYEFSVKFTDGTSGIVKMQKLIFGSKPGVFNVLSDKERFKEIYVSLGVVTWPGELDLAPDAMHEHIKKYGVWELE